MYPSHLTFYSDFFLPRVLWFPGDVSFYQIVLTQGYHCSQNAVIGFHLNCPYIKIVLTTSVLTKENSQDSGFFMIALHVSCRTLAEEGSAHTVMMGHVMPLQMLQACVELAAYWFCEAMLRCCPSYITQA